MTDDDIYGEVFSLPPGVLRIAQDDAEGADWGADPPEGYGRENRPLAAATGLCIAVAVGVVFWVVFIAGLIAIYRWVFV